MKSAHGRPAMRQLRASVGWIALLAACGTELATREQTVQSGPVVVINEFTAGSSGRIELYNAGDAVADLSGWQVDDVANGGTAPKSVGASVTLAPGAYLVVTYS